MTRTKLLVFAVVVAAVTTVSWGITPTRADQNAVAPDKAAEQAALAKQRAEADAAEARALRDAAWQRRKAMRDYVQQRNQAQQQAPGVPGNEGKEGGK